MMGTEEEEKKGETTPRSVVAHLVSWTVFPATRRSFSFEAMLWVRAQLFCAGEQMERHKKEFWSAVARVFESLQCVCGMHRDGQKRVQSIDL